MTDTMTSLRESQAVRAERRMLAAALAVIEAGEEPTMRAVAKAAGVSERTMYRYFPAREDLFRAVFPELAERCSAPKPARAEGLEAYAETLYGRYVANEALTRAMATAGWAAPYLELTRRRHVQELSALLARAYPDQPEEAVRNGALALRLVLSGSGWVHLRDCGLDPDEALAHARWQLARVRRDLSLPPDLEAT